VAQTVYRHPAANPLRKHVKSSTFSAMGTHGRGGRGGGGGGNPILIDQHVPVPSPASPKK
jgi:hypothetical protein